MHRILNRALISTKEWGHRGVKIKGLFMTIKIKLARRFVSVLSSDGGFGTFYTPSVFSIETMGENPKVFEQLC